jgi:hypothetical protein
MAGSVTRGLHGRRPEREDHIIAALTIFVGLHRVEVVNRHDRDDEDFGLPQTLPGARRRAELVIAVKGLRCLWLLLGRFN